MSRRKTHEQFVKELQEINTTVEVLGQYETALTKIQVKCSVCGKLWESKPSSLLNGRGCPDCANRRKRDALRKSTSDFIADLFAVNQNIEVLDEYYGNEEKIFLHCKVCGNEWVTTPHTLLSGHGCPMCGYERQKNAQRHSHNKFLLDLENVNSDIEVLDEYVNNHTKIRFQCRTCGRIWKTVPNSVLSGHGCPDCARSSTSFLEQVIFQSFCIALGEDAVISRDRNLIGMELDVVIPSLNVAYEPGSWAWHYNKKESDTKKRDRCKEIGYQLITIFTDYKLKDAPFDNNCYTCVHNLGNSNWEETKSFVKKLLYDQNLALSDDQWENVKEIAVEKSRKRTNEEYIEALYVVNPKIKVVGKYFDNSTKVAFQCMACGTVWKAMPGSVLSGHGCPKCGTLRSANAKRKSHEEFISEMERLSPNIIILGKYVDTKTKILCECCVCGNRWEMRPQNLLKGQGCPKCGRIRAAKRNSKTHNQFVDQIKLKNPLLIVCEQYVNSSTKIKVKCSKCGHLWNANPMDILNGHGCPKCAGLMKRTNTQFIIELKHMFPDIEPLEEYQSANKKIQVRCLLCDYTWAIRPHDLLRSKGCPNCRKSKKKATESI